MKFSTFSASFCALVAVANAANMFEVISPVSDTIWYAGSTASVDTLKTRVQAISDSENVPEEVTIGLYSTKWHRVFPIAEMTVSKAALAKGVDFKFDNEKAAENGPVMVKLYKRGIMGWRHTLAKSDNFRLFKVGAQSGIPKRYNFISDIEIVEADADTVSAVFTLKQAIPAGKKLEVQLVDALTNKKVGEAAELVGSKETIAGGATQILLTKPDASGSYVVKVYARIGMRFYTRHLLFRSAPTGPAHFLSGAIHFDVGSSSDASEEAPSISDFPELSNDDLSVESATPAKYMKPADRRKMHSKKINARIAASFSSKKAELTPDEIAAKKAAEKAALEIAAIAEESRRAKAANKEYYPDNIHPLTKSMSEEEFNEAEWTTVKRASKSADNRKDPLFKLFEDEVPSKPYEIPPLYTMFEKSGSDEESASQNVFEEDDDDMSSLLETFEQKAAAPDTLKPVVEKKPYVAIPATSAFSFKKALLADRKIQDSYDAQDLADYDAMNKSLDEEAFLGDGYDKIIADNYDQDKAEYDQMVEQNQADKVALESDEKAAQQPYIRKVKKQNKVKIGTPIVAKQELRDRFAAAQALYELEQQRTKDAAEAKKIAAEEEKARRYNGKN